MTPETMAALNAAMSEKGFDPSALAKAITQSTGLVAYNLEAPSKKLYPVLSPMRNELGRMVDGKGGTAVHWKGVKSIAHGTYQVGVEEGKRNAGFNLSTADYLGTYKGIGVEQSVSFEADYAGQTFEDMKGLAVLTNLQSLMIAEEKLILGGNSSIALGTTADPTCSTATTGGSIASTTNVVVSCVYLTHEGLQSSSVVGGVIVPAARTNADGSTTTSGYGAAKICSSPPTQQTGGSTQTNIVTATVAVKAGAVAYAWFWGATAGAAQKLGAITTVNQVVITVAAGTGTQTAAASTLGTDYSQDALAFDGLLSIANGAGPEVNASTSGAYLSALAAGATLTSDGAGGVVEIETMLQDRYDQYRLGFDTLWVNSAQASTITKIVVANGGAPLVRFAGELKGNRDERYGMAGGSFVSSYLNRYTGQMMRVIVHPYMPAGTIIATANELPYPVNNVNKVWQMRLRRDYYQIDWPVTSRSYPYGIYMDGFLQHYFPAAIGVISNITA